MFVGFSFCLPESYFKFELFAFIHESCDSICSLWRVAEWSISEHAHDSAHDFAYMAGSPSLLVLLIFHLLLLCLSHFGSELLHLDSLLLEEFDR